MLNYYQENCKTWLGNVCQFFHSLFHVLMEGVDFMAQIGIRITEQEKQ